MPFCFEWDEAKRLPRELFEKAARAGIIGCLVGAPWPKQYTDINPPGGVKAEEYDAFHELIVCDELSRCGSGGVVWGLIGGRDPFLLL